MKTELELLSEIQRLAPEPALAGWEVDQGRFLIRLRHHPAQDVLVWLRPEPVLEVLRRVSSGEFVHARAEVALAPLMRPPDADPRAGAVVSWQGRGGTRYSLGDKVQHYGTRQWGTIRALYPQPDGGCELLVEKDPPRFPGDSTADSWWATYHIGSHRKSDTDE